MLKLLIALGILSLFCLPFSYLLVNVYDSATIENIWYGLLINGTSFIFIALLIKNFDNVCNFLKNNKKAIIVCFSILMLVSLFYFINFTKRKEEDNKQEIQKKYEAEQAAAELFKSRSNAIEQK